VRAESPKESNAVTAIKRIANLKYRAEIDGLRALAVVPVILFHAGFELFSGGFVGVDVFFVISGYLITTIILSELEQGKFSIVNFYERRARRILPALFIVMLVCIPFAWFWLLPRDMKDFSESLVAVPFFASNILFWRESGYFDAAAELKPLLHTWSLAVEEQYYVLFPIFLMLFWRLGKRWVWVTLGLVFVASLAVAEWAAYNKPSAAFYLLPTRGWELLIGAFAAFYLSKVNRKDFGKGLSEVAGWFGVALIMYAVFAFSKATPFPGFYALVPTIGTVLVILFATQQTTVGKFVGNKAFVGIGLISYSAYLWHQPLFAFAKQRSLLEPNQFVFLILSIWALILAYFSWRFVEAPFRNKSLISRRRVFLFSLVGSFLFVCVGLFGQLTDGKFYGRINGPIFDLDRRVNVNQGLSIDCEGDYNVSPNCSTSDKPEVLLWGDSYAMHLAQGFLASNPSIGLVQKTVSVCGPFIGIAPTNAKYVRSWAEKCLARSEERRVGKECPM
jgi:peptidoglycan/LPS O-acetylase OafA/YrhL